MLCKLLLFLALSLGATCARADDITLTNGEWLPYQSEHLPHYGVLSRIVSEAFALEGVTVHYVFRPWPRALAEAQQGRAQGAIVWGQGSPGSSRNRNFHFSDLVFEDKSVYFHRKDFPFTWTTRNDLAKYRLGGVAGYEYSFEQVPGVRIDRAATDELCLRKLLAGRFDIFPSSLDVGRYILRTRFSAEDAARFTWNPGANITTRYYLLLPRSLASSPHYLTVFNKGLKRLKDSGRYAEYLADLEAGKY
ncbi:MAG: transporter substrate-binding domain-containing protein [Pseudomonadota bacterium]